MKEIDTPNGNGKDHDVDNLDLLDLYLRQIPHGELLTREQEVQLAGLIRVGKKASQRLENSNLKLDKREKKTLLEKVKDGKKAFQELASANLRLVVSIAKKHKDKGRPFLTFLDLIQEGNEGLFVAVDKFDPNKGYKFSTYATWWIRQSITREIEKQSKSIRVPPKQFQGISRLNKAVNELYQEKKREPQISEIAKKMGISLRRAERLLRTKGQLFALSLDEIVNKEDGEDTPLHEMISDQSPSPVSVLLKEELLDAMDDLYYGERELLKLSFFADLTYTEVARVFGVTHETIRKREKIILQKLREKIA